MQPGKYLRITTKNGIVFQGTVLPASSDAVVLKLESGYNVGIDKKNIAKQETVKSKSKESKKTTKVKRDEKLPKILLLHTGGTIASKVDYQKGGTTNLFEPEEILALYPELQEVANLEAKFIRNMSSDDFRFSHFNILAKKVEQAIKNKVAGVVITTGTDYMQVAGAALHYILESIPIPVVFVGSQRSADRGSSDAFTNLRGAVQFVREQIPGVFIGMHETSDDTSISILQAVNARKMHTSARNAFKPINTRITARVSDGQVEIITPVKNREGKFSVKLLNEKLKVGICYTHPNFFPEQLACYESFDGLIILGSGLGHVPINVTDESTKVHEKVYKQLKKLAKKMPVVLASHCIHGRVSLQVYGAARRLQEIGVLGHDLALTPETLFIKLTWILSQKLDPKQALYQDFADIVQRTQVQG